MLRTNCLEGKTEVGRRCLQTPARGGQDAVEHPIGISQRDLLTDYMVKRGAEPRRGSWSSPGTTTNQSAASEKMLINPNRCQLCLCKLENKPLGYQGISSKIHFGDESH